MTLDFALSLPVEPGSNPRGEQADTTWLFLLDALDLGKAVVVGAAPPGTLVALAALAHRVELVGASPRTRRRARRLAAERGLDRLGLSSGRGRESLRGDVVYVDARHARRLARDERSVGELSAVLDSGGAIYVAAAGRLSRGGPGDLARRLRPSCCMSLGTASDGRAASAVETARDREEAHLDAPDATARSAWLVPAVGSEREGIRGRLSTLAMRVARRAWSRPGHRPGSTGAVRVSEPEASLGVESVEAGPCEPPSGCGVLLRASADIRLPAYLREAAAHAGVALEPHGWRLAPPRGYRSQKVIFFTRAGDGSEAVVKVTQDGRFNRLLENEAAALEALAGRSFGDSLVVPRALFSASHAGLAIVTETALPGTAFSALSVGGGSCEHAAAVCRAITELGVATVTPGRAVESALGRVVEDYVRLYDPTTRRLRDLEASVARIGALGADLPLVFMHGDATVYNVLLAPGGRVGLVDWENADPAGIPLWDLFHFLQTYAAWNAERAGARFTPEVFAQSVLGGHDLEPLRSRALDAYCREVGVPGEAVEPLLWTYLARHAVREARQLRPDRLHRGLQHRLLCRALEPAPPATGWCDRD